MKDYLKKIIREAGGIGREYFKKGVTHRTKAHLGDLLTVADEEVSNFLVQKILLKYPDHKVTSEEMQYSINPEATIEWVIDPIDGTRNFALGIPIWCVMVAVLENGETMLAAVYDAMADELFFAEKGHGATLNNMPIRVNDVDSFDHGRALVCRSAYHKTSPMFANVIAKINTDMNVWLVNLGARQGMVYVATGAYDFVVEDAGKDYDNLAPVLICQEAGAIVTNEKGEPWTRYETGLVIANPKLHAKVLEFFD